MEHEIVRQKRADAAVVDWIIIIAVLFGALKIIFHDAMPGSHFIHQLCWYAVATIVIGSKDLVFRNASIGKKIYGLHVVREFGRGMPTVKSMIMRNIPLDFLFPIELVKFMNGEERLGDEWAHTVVELVNPIKNEDKDKY